MSITFTHCALLTTCFTATPTIQPADQARLTTSRPNILFIFTDDHAAQAISAYGSRIANTPNIDRLAREGMLFRNCFVTNAICAPSRAVILTGKHSHLNGVPTNAETFDGSQQTFPKLLREVGYETAIIGKWHLKSDPTGFDHWEVLLGQGPYYNPPLKTPGGVKKHTGYTTEIITDRALDWLQNERDADKPFLLMCQHKAPHRNWQPGPDYLTMFDDVVIPEPDTLFDDYVGRASGARHQEMSIAGHMFPSDLKLEPPRNLTEEQLAAWNAAYEPKNKVFEEAALEGDDLVRWRYQRYIKDYLRTIAAVDDNVGRVLDYLDKSGLADNTIVIYSSDQGFYLGEHGWYDKRWMYEESLRMPFIVRWPGRIAADSIDEHLVQNLDFAPTFLDVAGATIPDDMQGRSIAPLLKGKATEDWRRSVYYHYYEFPGVHAVPRHYGVRSDRYKLIRYYQLDEWELFDLQVDPNELKSVYDDPKLAPIAAELKAELTRLQKQYDNTNPEESLVEIGQRIARRRAADTPLHLAMQLIKPDGKTHTDLDPSMKTLTVGAWCTPKSPDGVLIAHGGEVFGYCLYLRDGVPHFAVRSRRELREVAGEGKLRLNEPAHLAAMLDAEGTLHLYVNGKPIASAPGYFITARPSDGLDVGRDTGSPVGSYDAEFPFTGDLSDVRVYWGCLDEKELRATWVSPW